MITIRKAETDDEIDKAVEIQLAVFSREQGISEPECREGNEDSVHLLAFDGHATVATARLRPGCNGEAEVARIAVLPDFRGTGLGKMLVKRIESVARESGIDDLVLHPHAYLEGFYSGLGYARTDDASYVVGEHAIITMRKSLAADKRG